MICSICKRQVSSTSGFTVDSSHVSVCSQCAYTALGILMIPTDSIRSPLYTYDGLVIWINNDNRVYNAWDHGRTLPKSFLKDKDACDIISDIRSNGSMLCTHCGCRVEKFAGSHFAGYFCDKCWNEYKINNSGKCGMCGSPRWECVC